MKIVSYASNATTSQADPIIKQHSIHWMICKESYMTSRRNDIEGWILLEDDIDWCIYTNNEKAICAFRGTATAKDLVDDIRLSIQIDACTTSRFTPAIELVNELLQEYSVQVTGHSLGGAVAQCVGTKLKLGCVTFNSAASPLNPVTITNPNSANYHIVWDIISAWEHPNVIRIDKGYHTPRGLTGAVLGNYDITSFLRAHALENFSNARPGHIVSAEYENSLWKNWWSKVTSSGRGLFFKFIKKRFPTIKN